MLWGHASNISNESPPVTLDSSATCPRVQKSHQGSARQPGCTTHRWRRTGLDHWTILIY